MKAQQKSILLMIFALVIFGLIQVYSSSFIFAIENYDDGLLFFRKQLIFAFVGFTAMIAIMKMPYHWIEKYGWTLWFFASAALILTFIPGVGVKVGGAQRWIQLPFGFRLEPCELMKLSLPMLIARYARVAKKEWVPSNIVFKALVVAVPMLLLLLQPDFGSFTLCFLVIASLLFAFGLPWRYIFLSALVALPCFYFLVMNVGYRRARVLAFLNPWENPEGSGFQLIQSLLSFHSGGLTGVGLGDGQGKLFFLPAAHTDFTLAVLGEELGFLGFSLLLSCYGFLVFKGFQLSFSMANKQKQVLAMGLTLTFAYSVFVNIGVALGLLPTKGLTLPFLSYGGSSLIMNCMLFGLLLNLFSSHRRPKRRLA